MKDADVYAATADYLYAALVPYNIPMGQKIEMVNALGSKLKEVGLLPQYQRQVSLSRPNPFTAKSFRPVAERRRRPTKRERQHAKG